MKKSILIIIIPFLFCVVCYSQQNYLSYFQLKNKAEVAICQEQYQEALDYYKQALNMVDFPLGKEIYNAYLCAAIVNDTTYIYNELDRYSGRIIFDRLIQKKIFQPYIYTFQWENLIEKAKILREEYLKTINTEYVSILDSLNMEDQKPRKKRHPLKIKNIKKREQAMKYWLYTDSCVAVVLDTLISKYDYPNERNTANKYTMMPPICIWHRHDSTFTEFEYRMLLEGKVEPEVYAKKQDYVIYILNHSEPANKQEILYCERYSSFPSDSEKLKAINENRNKIGLPTLDELKIMNDYITNKNQYGFVFHFNWFKRW